MAEGNCNAGLILVLAGAVRYVWAMYGHMHPGYRQRLEGRRYQAGLSLGESGCLTDALQRHGRQPCVLASSVSNGLRLSGCLESSRIEAHFCERVPSADDFLPWPPG